MSWVWVRLPFVVRLVLLLPLGAFIAVAQKLGFNPWDVNATKASGDGPPCTCGSTAVIDSSRHAANCQRRVWREWRDQMVEQRR